MVGLGKTQTRAVGEFSKGMQRRIGLAQALINDPDLVILDEPTAGLDPIGCREVKDLIVALARRGKTVILSSHLLSDVEDVCDRVVIYYGGKIQAAGHAEGIAGQAGHAAHHDAGAAARNAGARAGDHPQGRRRPAKCAWTIRRRTSKAIFSMWWQKARAAATETSGAQSGARVARVFARRRGRARPAAEKILEKLALPQAAQPAAEPKPAAPVAAPKVDDKKLEALAQVAATPAPAKPASAPEEKPVDLSKADEKLSSLLGKKHLCSRGTQNEDQFIGRRFN